MDKEAMLSEALNLLKVLISTPSMSREEEAAANALQNYMERSGILTNLSGQVLGIICQENSAEDTPNLITAYGISGLKNLIEKLSNGQPSASLGIFGTDVPKEIQETQGVPAGAYVTGIVMDSPAMVAGIQSGDVIVQMGTVPVESFADYRNTLMGLLPDTELTLTVMRQVQEEYQEMTVDVLLNTLE